MTICISKLLHTVAARDSMERQRFTVSSLSTGTHQGCCVMLFVVSSGGQSGTTETRHERDALPSELGVGRRVDEDVDGAVGVCQPHDDELHGGRRLKRAAGHLVQ